MIIEKTVLEYLQEQLNTADVYPEIPEEIPDTFIVIDVIDRGKADHIDAVTMEIWSYAKTKYEAALLDEQVREAMDNMAVLPEIGSSTIGGGNDSNDKALKRYRYRCYYNIYY